MNKSGLEGGDGVITLIVGAVVVLVSLARLTDRTIPTLLQRSPIILGAIAAIIAALNLSDISGRINTAEGLSTLVTGSVGAGIYTIFVGAALAIVGGFQVRTGNGGEGKLPAPRLRGIDIRQDGRRYTLGEKEAKGLDRVPEYFIWDKAQPGPPIARFPATDEGRTRAQQELRRLEAESGDTPDQSHES